MIQKDKQLLLADLCARLPYSTIVSVTDGTIKYNAYIESVSYKNIQVSPVNDSNFTAYTFYKISEIKPYLRPMSSMTEEEKKELQETIKSNPISPFGKLTNKCDNLTLCCAYGSRLLLDYLYSKHFDVVNLIEKGLALVALEGMYKF